MNSGSIMEHAIWYHTKAFTFQLSILFITYNYWVERGLQIVPVETLYSILDNEWIILCKIQENNCTILRNIFLGEREVGTLRLSNEMVSLEFLKYFTNHINQFSYRSLQSQQRWLLWLLWPLFNFEKIINI